MSSRKSKVVGGLATIVALGIALPVLFAPSEVCACLTPTMDFLRHAFGADPIESSESELRAALQSRHPIGAPFGPLEQERRAADPRPGDGDGHCVRTEASLRCHVVLTESAFDLHRSELEVEFLLDRVDRIAGHRVKKTRWLLGFEL